VERLSALELDHAVALTELHAKGAQHALGVIPRGRGLADCGAAAGGQPGQEQRGLHLRARDRECVLDAIELRSALNADRRPALLRRDACAHAPQGCGDPLHRPPHERCVANEGGIEGLRCEHPHHEAHAGARISQIERRRGRREPRRSPAMDP
jgi:hypothetical protein